MQLCLNFIVNRKIHNNILYACRNSSSSVGKEYVFRNTTSLRAKSFNYLSAAANPLQAEAFNDGETGLPPRNTSKRADVTFDDSIAASTEEGIPSGVTKTCKCTE